MQRPSRTGFVSRGVWAGCGCFQVLSGLCVNGWEFPTDTRDSWGNRAVGTFRTQLGAPGNVVRTCFSLGGLLGFFKYFAWVQKVLSGIFVLPGSAVILPGMQHLIPRAQNSHPGTAGVSSPALQVPELTARGPRVISPSKREIKRLKGSNCYKNKSRWFWLK